MQFSYPHRAASGYCYVCCIWVLWNISPCTSLTVEYAIWPILCWRGRKTLLNQMPYVRGIKEGSKSACCLCCHCTVLHKDGPPVTEMFCTLMFIALLKYTVWVKKCPPCSFLTFFPNSLEFLINFSHTYYTFLSTLDYKFLFSYLQCWQSYAILSVTTQRFFTFH